MRVKIYLTPEEAKGNDRAKIAIESLLRYHHPDYDDASIAASYDIISSSECTIIVFLVPNIIGDRERILYVSADDPDCVSIDTFIYEPNASAYVEFPKTARSINE